jgi:deoxyribonuclease-4
VTGAGGAPAAPGRPIGAHVSTAGGLAAGGLRYAAATGAEAVQVFATNPRGWAPAPGDPAQDAAVRAAVERDQLPVFVHAPYLINLGSPDARVWDLSVGSLRYSLARGAQLGARGVIVHTGSAVGGDRAAALSRVREALLTVLDGLPGDGPDLLLEPMASQRAMLCSGPADLRAYLEMLDWHPRAGICLDTCHAFAAGHDLADPGGAARLLSDLESAGCGGRLRLIHANDSKDPCRSGRDRHENIGDGLIGTEPFAALLGHPATMGIPFIIETPGGEKAHAADIARLRALRGSVTMAAPVA